MSLRHAALGLLSRRPASGYDLLKVFEASMANVWPATQSQLYGELNKLADAGLIEAADVGPRGRKEYAITDAGRAELQRWMTSPQEDPAFRSAQLLRVFLLDELAPEEARKYLAALRAHADSEHGRYEQIRDATNGRMMTRRFSHVRRWRTGCDLPRCRRTGRVGCSTNSTSARIRVTGTAPLRRESQRCIAIGFDISLTYRQRTALATRPETRHT